MAQADRTSTTSSPVLHPIPRFGRGLSALRLANPRPSLADDLAFERPDPLGYGDPDVELFTWPDMIDQRRIGEPGQGRFAHDDAELDDGV